MKLLCSLFLVILVSACSTTNYSDRTVARMNDVSSKPSWASIEKPVYRKNGKVYAIGFADATGSARVSALSRVSDNHARLEIIRLVQNSIGLVYQNVDEGVTGEGTPRFVGTEKASVVTSNLIPEKRYYEKVLVTTEDGERVLRLHMYSLVSIKENSLRRHVRLALQQDRKVSAALQQQVDNQLQQLIQE